MTHMFSANSSSTQEEPRGRERKERQTDRQAGRGKAGYGKRGRIERV